MGYYTPTKGTGRIGNFVWEDLDHDGIQDQGESGIANVTIKLLDSYGAVLDSTITDSNGAYSFDCLKSGNYRIAVVKPSGFDFTQQFSRPSGVLNPAQVDSNINPNNGKSNIFFLRTGEDNQSIDVGLIKEKPPEDPKTGIIGDCVWEDVDGDGFQDNGEPSLAGITVNLLTNGTIIATQTTDANGLYAFENLMAGSYQVQVIKPSDFTFTKQFATVNGERVPTIDSNINPATGISNVINLQEGKTNLTIDAGLKREKPPEPKKGAIGNFVWEDVDGDGFQDNGEGGIAGVEVILRRGDDTFVTSQVTDANGQYLFDDLIAGSYQVEVVTPENFTYTKQFATVNGQRVPTIDSNINPATGISNVINLQEGKTNLTIDAGLKEEKPPIQDPDCPTGPIGGVDLGDLTKYLFFFANGNEDANWQGATKGFAGDVVVDGLQAQERTSGDVPYAGTIYTNDLTLSAWQDLVDQNPGQATAKTGQTSLVVELEADLNNAFAQINSLAASPGFESVSSSSLQNLNTNNNSAETIVINVTSELQVSQQIKITGDAEDVYVIRWDEDPLMSGYQGQVKFQSGGGIVPGGELTPGNFINVAGDINASGGGSTPEAPYPQGPRLDDGMGDLIEGGKDFSGGGLFTGYWLTTGSPNDGKTASLSNAIFTGGWYTFSDNFSLTSGTSGVHVCPNPATQDHPHDPICPCDSIIEDALEPSL